MKLHIVHAELSEKSNSRYVRAESLTEPGFDYLSIGADMEQYGVSAV